MSALGISVPEGHVEVLEAAADNLRHVARAADRTSSEMRRAAKVDGWEGSASEAFTHTIAQNSKPADIAEQQLPRAAKALSELADDLRDARRATQHAIKAARAAVERRDEAQRDATAAQQRAQNATAEATALQGVIDGATVRGDPANASRDAHREATRAAAAAGDAAADARRRADKAAHDLQEAQRDGRVANERYDQACQQAARVLQAVAAAAPGANKGDDAGVDWKDVYHLLRTAWNGGPGERHVPALKLVAGLLMVAGTKKYLKTLGRADYWKMINPAYRKLLLNKAMPTFNNGLLARGLRGPLSKVPGLSRAMGWFGDASKATPYFRGLGLAGSAVSLVDDINRIAHPNKDTAAFVSDLARTGFDVSTTAFLLSPNPVTGGAVIVTGAIWAGTEIWDHHEEIGKALDDGVDIAKDTVNKIGDGLSDIGGGIASAFS